MFDRHRYIVRNSENMYLLSFGGQIELRLVGYGFEDSNSYVLVVDG